MKRPWTTHEERELRLCYEQEYTHLIAWRLGRSIESIRVKAKKMGLRKNKDPDRLLSPLHSSRSTS